jgi:hypothetical protein
MKKKFIKTFELTRLCLSNDGRYVGAEGKIIEVQEPYGHFIPKSELTYRSLMGVSSDEPDVILNITVIRQGAIVVSKMRSKDLKILWEKGKAGDRKNTPMLDALDFIFSSQNVNLNVIDLSQIKMDCVLHTNGTIRTIDKDINKVFTIDNGDAIDLDEGVYSKIRLSNGDIIAIVENGQTKGLELNKMASIILNSDGVQFDVYGYAIYIKNRNN